MPREPPLSLLSQRNEVWSMDFSLDALSQGRRIKILKIVDECTKEVIDFAVDLGISGHCGKRILDHAVRFRGYRKAIRTDQGPEFTGRALDQWIYEHGGHGSDRVLSSWSKNPCLEKSSLRSSACPAQYTPSL